MGLSADVESRKQLVGRMGYNTALLPYCMLCPPLQEAMPRSAAESLAEARRMRRKRNLDQIEIPEDHLTLTNELLGRGGFGAVYIADYNGRNAAAKVRYREAQHFSARVRWVNLNRQCLEGVGR